ncbi:MAG: hypothetical protein WC312_04745 [Candidatus Omnitrophota bacterium]|jgi:hypothetical protein
MKKIYKITNIAAISVLAVMLSGGSLYAENICLRVPLSFGTKEKQVSLDKQVFASGLKEKDISKLGEPQEILSGYIGDGFDFRDKLLGNTVAIWLLRELFEMDEKEYDSSELGVTLDELAHNAVSLNIGKKRVYFKVEFFSFQENRFETKKVMRFIFKQSSSRASDRERLAINGKGFNGDGRWDYLLNLHRRKRDGAYVKDGGSGLYNVGDFLRKRQALLIYTINRSSPFDIKTELYVDSFFPAPARRIKKRQTRYAL